MNIPEPCIAAVNEYGIDSQSAMFSEEAGELLSALNKYARGRINDKHVVITEIADVLIMCKQLAYFFGADEVEAEIERKLHRLSENIELTRKSRTNK